MDYDLDNPVTVGGRQLVPEAVDNFARKWVGGHYLLSFGLLIILTLICIYHLAVKTEKFNPTATLRMQQRDGTGEGMTDREQSAFAQQTQSAPGGQFTVDPNAKPGQPGSLSAQILASPDFNCAGRKVSGDDAWAWMNGVAHENMTGAPVNDNDFSKVLAGHA